MDIVKKYWSNFGGLMACFILINIALSDHSFLEINSLIWLNFTAMLVHQFEEYSYPGQFPKFYNETLLKSNKILKYPLTTNGILLVNVGLAWTFYIISGILGDSAYWFALGLALISLSNGMLHTFMFFYLKRYNPGLITSLVIFIPFGFYLIYRIQPFLTQEDILSGIIIFIFGSAFIPVTIFVTSKYS
ncbi:MAG: HXXEE domain-containing protein [Cytophagaceae bacterium]|nr:HXXEE domain-containing protein [Cytophagaceae bacterium]